MTRHFSQENWNKRFVIPGETKQCQKCVRIYGTPLEEKNGEFSSREAQVRVRRN